MTVKDASGQSLGTVETPEAGIGGKGPGKFSLVRRSGTLTVAPDVAHNAASLWVEAMCTGSVDKLWGKIDVGQAVNDIKAAFVAAQTLGQ